ncbi:MAG: LacI family DNA-binding transcriptional regulator [Agathobacter sp.]|nr:LacI family DNA-binding transcriptional regulator [Agathobacter sp.]
MAKAVKLADIAEKLNVSVVTVSKALSGQKGVSEEMRERIQKLADEMGYIPTKNAAGRRPAVKSYNIGVIIQESYLDKYDSFYWMMYQRVATHAMEKGSFTMLEVVSQQMEKALELPKLLEEQKVDGIIVVGKPSERYLALIREKTKIPTVYMDFADEGKTTDAVVSDNYYGGYYATNYLLSMGHTKIAYVGTLLATSSITDRYLGYVKALMEHGIEIRKDWHINDRNVSSGLIDDENMMVLPDEMPTAFFCNCDLVAGKLINKLQRQGYRVPEDISVVGYDNYIHPDLCNVEITSYEVDFEEMAAQSVAALIQKMSHGADSSRIHVVEGHLVLKNSVRRI